MWCVRGPAGGVCPFSEALRSIANTLPGHATAGQLPFLQKLGIRMDDVFTFSGVRNPWDRQVRWCLSAQLIDCASQGRAFLSGS